MEEGADIAAAGGAGTGDVVGEVALGGEFIDEAGEHGGEAAGGFFAGDAGVLGDLVDVFVAKGVLQLLR